MKILFEAYPYEMKDVKNVLGGLLNDVEKDSKKPPLKYVGYFFNKDVENRDGTKGDIVFILPQVLLDANLKVFGLSPKDIIDFNYEDWKKDELVVEGGNLSKRQVYDFIFGFAVWVYRAVTIYRKKQDELSINDNTEDDDETNAKVYSSLTVGQSGRKNDVTFMDIMLSLLDFQRTHSNFIVYVMKMAHSGFNKVSWPKTIARTQPIVQNAAPIYLSPINKKRVVDFDEELFVIYYSILNYMHDEYGFPIPGKPGYDLITGTKFKSYIKSQGKTRLHQIRYKYYNDDALLLWNLCYAFFDRTENLQVQTNRRDYLLVKKFETVFEGMIDELIGDKNLPKGLKIGADDKRIDHLYTYKYLIEDLDTDVDTAMSRRIYNIADSKYYRRDKNYQEHDVPKQFTYVRNVTQWHMDLIHGLLDKQVGKDHPYKSIPLFDALTEGYNIIPNFFISAFADENLDYNVEGFERSQIGGVQKKSNGEIPWVEGKNLHLNYFFWERLFDRSTGITLHYNVNFLFVLKKYAQNRSSEKAAWREEVQKKLREDILEYLNDHFDFYQVVVKKDEMQEFVEKHYRKIIGKVFSFEDSKGNTVLLYAERKDQKDGKPGSFVYDELKHAHVAGEALVVPLSDGISFDSIKVRKLGSLGEDSFDAIVETGQNFEALHSYDITPSCYIAAEQKPSFGVRFDVANHVDDVFLLGCYNGTEHKSWIEKAQMYNVRLGDRKGAVDESDKQVVEARYLLLYDFDHPSRYELLGIDNEPKKYLKTEMVNLGYPNPHGDEYFLYKLCDEPESVTLDIEKLLCDKQVQKGSPLEGAPVYLTGEELKQYLTSSPSPKP